MFYYKIIEDNILIGLLKRESKISNDIFFFLSSEEYNNILSVIASKPEDTESIIYKLHADTLEYVAYDRPAEPVIEPTDPVVDSIISEVASNGY